MFGDDSVTGVMVTLAGQEFALSGTLDGEVITVTGGGQTFSLGFYPEGNGDPGLLGGTAGFYGDWVVGDVTIGGVIGSSCKLN